MRCCFKRAFHEPRLMVRQWQNRRTFFIWSTLNRWVCDGEYWYRSASIIDALAVITNSGLSWSNLIFKCDFSEVTFTRRALNARPANQWYSSWLRDPIASSDAAAFKMVCSTLVVRRFVSILMLLVKHVMTIEAASYMSNQQADIAATTTSAAGIFSCSAQYMRDPIMERFWIHCNLDGWKMSSDGVKEIMNDRQIVLTIDISTAGTLNFVKNDSPIPDNCEL